jgi:2-methylcitrate dehydratase PrpD
MSRSKHSSYSEQLAEFVVKLKFSDIPSNIVDKMKLHFIDSVGLALAGSKEATPRQIVLLSQRLGGPPESSIIGSLKKVAASNAAMANSAMMHSLDFDDTHLGAGIHVSSFVIPTALAMAEQAGASGKAVIEAAVSGAEVACRMGLAFLRYKPNDRGIHTTCIISPHGAAVVAGKLMGLNAKGLAGALGIAGSMSSGLLQGNIDGSAIKVFHPPWGCHGGILAACLSDMGFTGPPHVYEGTYGLYSAFFGPDSYDGNRLVKGLGRVWETNNISFKFYPGGHGIHYFLESIRELRQGGLRASEIGEIVLVINEHRVQAHFSKVKYAPPDEYTARFSMPYEIARMLLDGELGLDSYDAKNLGQREVLDLAKKVGYIVKPDAMDAGKEGTVIVKKKDGSTLEYRAKGIRGTPQRPAAPEDVHKKFLNNATRSMSRNRAEKSLQMLQRLDTLADIADLIKTLKVKV